MKKIFTLSTAIAFSVSLSNCSSDVSEVEVKEAQVKENTVFRISNSNAVPFTFSNQNISSDAIAETIFNNEVSGWNNLTIASIDANRLKFALPSGVGTSIGFECRVNCTDSNQYQIYYDLKFDSGFSFSKGGKIGLGFAIGDGVTGGRNTEATIDNKGGSFRVMWRTTSSGTAYLHPYVYYKDMTTQFGTDFQSSQYNIVANTTYRVRLTIKTNTGASTYNGYAKMEVKASSATNYTTVWEKSNIRWSGNSTSANRQIKTFYLSAFRGGSDSTWAGTSGTDNIFIDNVNWTDVY
jgi:hypothetical protein